jgi:tetratricopeptide (TPR) repeat protein
MTENPRSTLRLPSAVLRVWRVGPDGEEVDSPALVSHFLLRQEGVFELSPKLFTIVPRPGDDPVFDAALTSSQVLLREAETEDMRILAFPGVVTVDGSTAELLPNPLVEDLERRLPPLLPGIHLTGRAAKVLEYPPVLELELSYEGPSGKALPIFRVGETRHDHLPWRNPEVFGTLTQFVPRDELADWLGGVLTEPAARISGPMGCGKTRLLWEKLAQMSGVRLWLRTRPQRISTPTLGEQIVHQLLLPSERQLADPLHPNFAAKVDREEVRKVLQDRPSRGTEKDSQLLAERALTVLDRLAPAVKGHIWIVVDDFHLAGAADSALVDSLLSSSHLGSVYRVVLIGRSGTPWPLDVNSVSVVEVPLFDQLEMASITDWVISELSLPESVHGRFLDSVGGYPFAFEEVLFALIHEKNLRRIYGSFFFGGDTSTEFQPSHRLVRHVEAEVERLGEAFPVRLLAAAGTSAPAPELASAASLLGEPVSSGWEKPFLEAQILRETESPWGPGVEIIAPVKQRALAQGMAEDDLLLARQSLGQLLAGSCQTGEAHWRTYKLLEGSEGALESLTQLFKTSFTAHIPREELLEGLARELRQSQKRDLGPELELEMLWRLVPLARRLGTLNKYSEDLSRGVELATSRPNRLLALASVKAEMEQQAGHYQEAERTIQSALKAAAGIEARRKALLMIQLGRLFLRQNRFEEAKQLFTDLQRAFTEAGSSALAATCLFHLGNIALHTGELEESMRLHLEALAERRRQKLLRPTGSSVSALGTVAMNAGNYPQALDYYREAEKILEEHGKEGEVSYPLLGLARTLSRLGDSTSATKPVRRALKLREGRDDVAGEAIARLAVARNYLDIGKPDTALEEARKAHFRLSMASAEGPLADAEEVLGKILLNQRQLGEAKQRFTIALEKHRARNDKKASAFVIASLIEIGLAEENTDDIRNYTAELKNALKEFPHPDLSELLDFRIYRSLVWLASQGHKVGDPTSYLESAYREVLRKAQHLDHELRHRYLFQMAENQAIVEAATRLGLEADGQRNTSPRYS